MSSVWRAARSAARARAAAARVTPPERLADTEPERVVRCAECGERYRLPESLMGARGARVRCRTCGARFEVWRAPDAEAVAARVLEELADRIPAILIAQARGRLFAEAGDLLLEAFDAWRNAAGSSADPRVFRDALRSRWGVEVPGAALAPAPARAAEETR